MGGRPEFELSKLLRVVKDREHYYKFWLYFDAQIFYLVDAGKKNGQ